MARWMAIQSNMQMPLVSRQLEPFKESGNTINYRVSFGSLTLATKGLLAKAQSRSQIDTVQQALQEIDATGWESAEPESPDYVQRAELIRSDVLSHYHQMSFLFDIGVVAFDNRTLDLPRIDGRIARPKRYVCHGTFKGVHPNLQLTPILIEEFYHCEVDDCEYYRIGATVGYTFELPTSAEPLAATVFSAWELWISAFGTCYVMVPALSHFPEHYFYFSADRDNLSMLKLADPAWNAAAVNIDEFMCFNGESLGGLQSFGLNRSAAFHPWGPVYFGSSVTMARYEDDERFASMRLLDKGTRVPMMAIKPR